MKILTIIFLCVISSIAFGQSKKNANDAEDYKRPTPEERANDQTEDMAKKLKLTDNQIVSVLAVNVKYAKSQEEFFLANRNETLPQEIMMKKIKDFKIAYDYNKDNEMKAILEEKQFSKYLKNKDNYGNKYLTPMRSNTGYSPQFNRYGGGGYRGY